MDSISRQLLMSGSFGVSDPNFANVSLLVHFDGADFGTTFIDSSANNFTGTPYGTARTRTDQAKFGSASMELLGDNSGVSFPDNNAFDLGAGDFTIESFVRFDTLPSSGGSSRIIGKSIGTNQRSYGLWQYNNGGTQSLYFGYSTTGEFWTDIIVPYTPTTSTWHHYAVTRSGSVLRFFVNGTQVSSNQTLTATFANTSAALELGGNSFDGNQDEFRLTKGVARYTSNFTVPTEAFPNY